MPLPIIIPVPMEETINTVSSDISNTATSISTGNIISIVYCMIALAFSIGNLIYIWEND